MQPNTIKDFIAYTTDQFKKHQIYYGHGTETPEDEAWWLVTGFLKLPINEDLPENDQLTQEQQKSLLDLIKKRCEDKIPTAYLLKEAYLDGLKFYVDERVLIPRSPIAELIRNHFTPWLPEDMQVNRILDLCTGSGCLGILAADYYPEAKVDISDISKEALEVAKINIETYHQQNQIRIIQSDVFNNLKNEKYDIIISNPPYVDAKDISEMPKEYHHEPRLGLAAGADGLDIVKRILFEANDHLNENGALIVEVGNSQEALTQQFPNIPFIWLEFEFGGEGVFLLHKQDLKNLKRQTT